MLQAVQKRTNRPQQQPRNSSSRDRPAAPQAGSWQQQEHEQQQMHTEQEEEIQPQAPPAEVAAAQGRGASPQLPQQVSAQQPWQMLAEDLQLLGTPGRSSQRRQQHQRRQQEQGHAVPLHDSTSSTSSSRSSNGMLQVAMQQQPAMAPQQPAIALADEGPALRAHSMPPTPQPVAQHAQQPLLQAHSLPALFAADTAGVAAAADTAAAGDAGPAPGSAPAALWQKLSKLAAGLASGKLCARHEAACRRCHMDVCSKLLRGQGCMQEQEALGGASHMHVRSSGLDGSSMHACEQQAVAGRGRVQRASVDHMQHLLPDPAQQEQQHACVPNMQLSPGAQDSTATMDAHQMHGSKDPAATTGPGSHAAAAHTGLASLQPDTKYPLERASSGMSTCRPSPLQLELLQLPQLMPQQPLLQPFYEPGHCVTGDYAHDAGDAAGVDDAAMDEDDGQPLSEAAYEALMDMMLDTVATPDDTSGATAGDTSVHTAGLHSSAGWPQGASAHMVQQSGSDGMMMHMALPYVATPAPYATYHQHHQQHSMAPGSPDGHLRGAFTGGFQSSCPMQF